MAKVRSPFLSALALLSVSVAAVLLFAAVLDMAAHMVIGFASSSKDAAYTAIHFASPAMSGWLVLLLVLTVLFAAMLARFGGMEAPRAPAGSNASSGGDGPHPGKVLSALAVLLVVAAAVKAATMESMIAGEGSVAGLFRYAGGLNRALAAKACFDEKAYVMRMSEALLADRPAFGRFARSWYWAYFADERATHVSKHGIAAIAALEPLYHGGRLTDAAAFEMAKLFFENGMAHEARNVIESLLTRNPRNVEYAEFKAALAAENEK